MHKSILFKKYLRGSSSLEETEKRSDESLSISLLKQRNRSNELQTGSSDAASANRIKVVSNEKIDH